MTLERIHLKSARRAFTLIEIVLATSIMAILLVCIHSAFFGALHLRERTINGLEAVRPTEEALEIIQRDLANLIVSTNGVLIGPLQSSPQTNMQPGQIGPDFYTTGGQIDGMVPWGYIEKVDYVLTPATNGFANTGGQDLVRLVTHNLLPISSTPQPDQRMALMGGVQNVTFLYYDGEQWQSTWDTTQVTNLPSAIKVQVQLAGHADTPSGLSAPLELVVPVDVLLNTNSLSASL